MSVLRRLLSPSYREAVRAESEGRYRDAARAYALCDQPRKVAEMHLLEAERRLSGGGIGVSGTTNGPGGGIEELRLAAHYLDALDGSDGLGEPDAPSRPSRRSGGAGAADAEGSAQKRLLRRIGQALLRALRRSGLIGIDRDAVHEVAQVLLRAGDLAGAAAAYELIGDIEQAAAVYEKLGDIDKVESLLGAQEQRRGRVQAERDHFERYRVALSLGQRDLAVAALVSCVEVTPAADRAEPLRLLEELRAQLLTEGRVRLRGADGSEALFLGGLPVVMGRGDGCALMLRDPGVSRAHAQIERAASREGEGAAEGFVLRDLGAKNGTSLRGLPLSSSGALPLRGEGELGIGQNVLLGYKIIPAPEGESGGDELRLRVLRGLDHGLCVRIAAAAFRIEEGLALRFERGRPLLRIGVVSGEGAFLNGQRAPREIQLLRGDVIEVDGRRWEVC